MKHKIIIFICISPFSLWLPGNLFKIWKVSLSFRHYLISALPIVQPSACLLKVKKKKKSRYCTICDHLFGSLLICFRRRQKRVPGKFLSSAKRKHLFHSVTWPLFLMGSQMFESRVSSARCPFQRDARSRFAIPPCRGELKMPFWIFLAFFAGFHTVSGKIHGRFP